MLTSFFRLLYFFRLRIEFGALVPCVVQVVIDVMPMMLLLGIISLGASFVLSLQGYFNPTIRANQLKSAAASLESLTWLYRARVGQFKLSDNTFSKRSEAQLMTILNQWRKDLVAASDLQQTDLKKAYPARIYTHYQQRCPPAILKKAKQLNQELLGEKIKMEKQNIRKHEETSVCANLEKEKEKAKKEKEAKAEEKRKEDLAKKRLERSLAEFADMKGGELRKELEKRKLETEGKKSELMERLAEAVEKDVRRSWERELISVEPP